MTSPNRKVILICIDGMRPDGFLSCGHPSVREMMQSGSYTLTGRTVVPPITLPVHYSFFRSVPPREHGILTNDFTTPRRQLPCLTTLLRKAGRSCAMFYGWEPLRDITFPEDLLLSEYIWYRALPDTDGYLTDRALSAMRTFGPDFVFLYFVETDEKGGHSHGWMSTEYLATIRKALGHVARVRKEFGEEYTVLVVSDHGGHGNNHGEEIPEDMTVPFFAFGPDFEPGREIKDYSILDIAPTIAELEGIRPDPFWRGRSLVNRRSD